MLYFKLYFHRFIFNLKLMMKTLRNIFIFSLVYFSYAQAQDRSKDTLFLDEVMVTAQKISERPLKVPMSVKAIGTKKIQQLQLNNVSELGRIAPNFQTYDDGGGLFPVFASRGIFTAETTPVMGIYIDGVPVFDTFGITNELANVKKIEIIKGAQGMLYGRSAIAGVIKITTEKPTNATKIKTSIGLGNLNAQKVNLYVQKPLVKDKLFMGANLFYNKRDGFVKNTYTNINLLNIDVLSAGVKLRFLPSENLRMGFLSTVTKSQKYAYAFVGGLDKKQKIFDRKKEKDNPYELHYNTQGNYNRFIWNNSFSLVYNASAFDLNAITTYQYTSVVMTGEELDWTSSDSASRDIDVTTQNFSQELRFNSTTDTPLKWLAGFFIHHINDRNKSTQNNGKAMGAYYKRFGFDEDAKQFPYSKVGDATIKQTGFAGFANVDYALTDRFKINAGLRYEQEFYHMNVAAYNLKNDKKITYDGTLLKIKPQDFDENVTFGAFSYKGGFAYEMGGDKLLWGSVGRGYRPGGVNQFAASNESKIFYPEFSLTTELGFKGKLSKLLRFDATVFYTDYINQQVYNLTDPANFTAAKMNLGNSFSYGLELDMQFLLSKNFAFDVAFGSLKTNITKFKTVAGFGSKEVDYSGKIQPYAPVANTSGGLRFQTDFTDDLHFSSYVDYQYQTKVFFDYGNTFFQPAYGLLNATFDISYKNYTLTFWGKNLLNKVYYSYGYSMMGIYNFASFGLPRTFGARFSVDF